MLALGKNKISEKQVKSTKKKVKKQTIKPTKKGWGMTQVVEHLNNKCKALSSSSSITTKKTRKKFICQ
jgi:hypothetical protein